MGQREKRPVALVQNVAPILLEFARLHPLVVKINYALSHHRLL